MSRGKASCTLPVLVEVYDCVADSGRYGVAAVVQAVVNRDLDLTGRHTFQHKMAVLVCNGLCPSHIFVDDIQIWNGLTSLVKNSAFSIGGAFSSQQ